MSNQYFDSANNPNRLVPYQVARSEDINATLDMVETGFELVSNDVKRSLKLPEGTTTDQLVALTAAARANNLVAFDSSGNIIAVGSDAVTRGGHILGWDVAGGYKLYDYANDITAPASQVAQDKNDVIQLKADTQAIKDGAISETSDIRDTALIYRNDALQFRNEAETFRNQAASIVSGSVIDDDISVSDMTWSSQKLSQLITDIDTSISQTATTLNQQLYVAVNSNFYTNLFY
jgi:hypothetical protein